MRTNPTLAKYSFDNLGGVFNKFIFQMAKKNGKPKPKGKVKRKIRKALRKVGRTIRKNPLKTAATIAGIVAAAKFGKPVAKVGTVAGKNIVRAVGSTGPRIARHVGGRAAARQVAHTLIETAKIVPGMLKEAVRNPNIPLSQLGRAL